MTKSTQQGPVQARKHGASALRLWRRHKARASLLAALALVELMAWAAAVVAGRARKAVRALRQERKKEVAP